MQGTHTQQIKLWGLFKFEEGEEVKSRIDVVGGAFTAEGTMIEPAQIILTLYDLELSEYRHNRDVIVKGADPIHDAQNPTEGNRGVT